jgi:hypothetical protein
MLYYLSKNAWYVMLLAICINGCSGAGERAVTVSHDFKKCTFFRDMRRSILLVYP